MEFNDAIEFEEHIEGHKDKRNIFLKRKRPPLIKNVPLSELNSSISDVVEFAPINFHTAPPAPMDNNDDEDDDWFPERKHLPISMNTSQVMITKSNKSAIHVAATAAAKQIVQNDVNKSSVKPEPSAETDVFEHQFEIVNLSDKYEDFVDEAKHETFFKNEESIEIENDDNHANSMDDHAFGQDDDLSDDDNDDNLHVKAIENDVKDEKPDVVRLDEFKRDIVDENNAEGVKQEEEEREEYPEEYLEKPIEEKKDPKKSEKKEKSMKVLILINFLFFFISCQSGQCQNYINQIDTIYTQQYTEIQQFRCSELLF